MTQRICAAAAFAACMTAPALAQDWYGGVELTYDRHDIEDEGVDLGTTTELRGLGFAGVTLENDWFAEAELALAGSMSIDDPRQEGLRDGEIVAARLGRSFGDYSLEGILGTMSVVSGDNQAPGLPDVDRTLVAVAGTYRFSSEVSGGLLIGQLFGDEFADGPSGLDAFDEFNHFAAHLDYRLNDKWSIVGSFAYGTGEMDFDRDDGSLRQFSVEARYDVPQLPINAYAGISDTRFWQQDPDVSADNDEASRISFFLGARWTFGAIQSGRETARVPLPDYLTWLASADGTLE